MRAITDRTKRKGGVMRRRRIFAGIVAAAVGVAGLAAAVAGEQRPMTLGLGKSDAVELPENIREVMISDPAIVQAIPRSARRVQLIGAKIGQASATFIAHDGRHVLGLDISVERDLAPVAALIKRLI